MPVGVDSRSCALWLVSLSGGAFICGAALVPWGVWRGGFISGAGGGLFLWWAGFFGASGGGVALLGGLDRLVVFCGVLLCRAWLLSGVWSGFRALMFPLSGFVRLFGRRSVS